MANDTHTDQSTPATDGVVRAALLIIGNEILSGRTQDKNLSHIALTLNEVGIRLSEVRVVPDVEAEIIDAVNALRARYAYVFTTGGIGPTHDDITSECIAKAFGQKLIVNPEARRRLQEHYNRTGMELNAMRLRMANTPEHATLIDNPVSTAPGFRVENVFVLAGVPKIMQVMLDGVKGSLKGGAPVLSRAITCQMGEGIMAAGLQAIQNRYPQVDIGSYPYYRRSGYGTTIILRHTEAASLQQAGDEVADLMRSLGAEPYEGEPPPD